MKSQRSVTTPGEGMTIEVIAHGWRAVALASAIGSTEHFMRVRFVSLSLRLRWRASRSRVAMAGTEPGSSDAAKMIAADAVACVEFQHPQRLIDRLSDPRFQDYLKLFPQYQKLLKDPKFGELSGGGQADRRQARHHLG